MILDPLLLIILLLIAALGFAASVFSPFLIELKRPRDKGPRRILKTPLERRIRSIGKMPAIAVSGEVEYSGCGDDLQEVLDRADLKAVRIGKDTLRILGDISFPPHLKVSDNIVVEGSLKVGDDCVFHRSLKARGSVLIGNRVVIKGNLLSEENVTVLDDVVIGGSVHSEGSVTMGEKVYVSLSVVAIGDVTLFENSEIKNNILTRGAIKVLKYPKLDLPSSIDEIG
jgi:NDP-sugar pyrophosphorylase family protein